MADVAASATIATTTSTTPTLHGETAGGDRAVTFGARAVSFGDRAVTFEEEPFVILEETSWEFYQRGGWKATNAVINSFLEEQYLLGVPKAAMNVDEE